MLSFITTNTPPYIFTESGISYTYTLEPGVKYAITPSQIREHKLACQAHAAPKNMPPLLNYKHCDEIASLLPSKAKIMITNAISVGMGDSLMGFRALEVFAEAMKAREIDLEITLAMLNPKKLAGIAARYRHLIQSIDVLPIRQDRLTAQHGYFDFGLITFQDGFSGPTAVHMQDFFLQAFGRLENIPREQKRLSWTLPAALEQIRLDTDRPTLLFHPRASAGIRSMTPEAEAKLTETLINKTECQIICCLPTKMEHERLTVYHCASVFDFGNVMRSCDKVLSVDSLPVHLADCLSKPCLGLFTSIDPDLRIRYYPHAEALWLDSGKASPIRNKHQGDQCEHVKNMWRRLDMSKITAWVNR